MNSFTTLLTIASLFVASQAYIVQLCSESGYQGEMVERNVWDNTCAYSAGFQSWNMSTYGGSTQQLSAYSQQACVEPKTSKECATGINRVTLGQCFPATDVNGGSNALSSYSNVADCPEWIRYFNGFGLN